MHKYDFDNIVLCFPDRYWGKVKAVLLQGEYVSNGRMSIRACNELGHPIGTLSHNVPNYHLDEDEVIVKTWLDNLDLSAAAMASGCFIDTGKRLLDGGAIEYQVWRALRHEYITPNNLNTIQNRRPLEVGNIYRFKGYKGNGFKITGMSLPGTPTDDGGLPGVAVKWLNKSGFHGWYPFKTETEFWSYTLFRNACDPEHA